MTDKHPGFENIAKKIAKREHVPLAEARAMLAAATRKDSPKAKENNPHLENVKGDER